MTGLRRLTRVAARTLALTGLVVLAACETSQLAPRDTSVTPNTRPAGVSTPAASSETAKVTLSPASREVAAYYARMQTSLLSKGLLRTDGGGPDAPITDTILTRNFMAIALEEEYVRGQGLRRSRPGATSAVKKWTQPIRMSIEFTPNVPVTQRDWDRRETSQYANRLAGITGHPITLTDQNPNYHVIFTAEDDHRLVAQRIQQIVPDVNPSALRLFRNIPRGIHCLVVAFATRNGGYDYGTAIAVIRSEHPELMRKSCIHEEIAQGMGLGNDDPRARPTIFNDDDEFALLTRHDELLLQILYDPALRPGMRAEQALPLVRRRVSALLGNDTPS